jgi:hypothetical protein
MWVILRRRSWRRESEENSGGGDNYSYHVDLLCGLIVLRESAGCKYFLS